ncbi:TRAP transporter small permease [Paracoccus sp. (in: a-proteobacteria)]|uniref:TRAP transporter small permease n=1 Tax=Paracoccus sp. TaxID=267 RepID=UPI003A84100A
MRTVLSVLQFLESTLATLAYVGVGGMLIADVLGRELFGVSILGLQKLAIYAAIVAGFVGLSLATAANVHLRPEVFDRLVPPHYDGLANRISDGFAALFFAGLGVIAIRFVMQSADVGDKAAIFYFVLWPIQIVMPYAFFSCAFRHLAFALRPDLKPRGEAK